MKKYETAVFALGCFWGVQAYFDKINGVVETEVGYTGGIKKDPLYTDLGDHTEAVKILFDPEIVSYDELLKAFFEKRDPSFYAPKEQYKSAIYYLDREQKEKANAFAEKIQEGYIAPIATEILRAEIFYRAEEYHQKYIEKNSGVSC